MPKIRPILAALAAVVALTGCQSAPTSLPLIAIQAFAAVSKSSPAQTGFGGSATLGIGAVAGVGLRAAGGYEYSMWDGGHDDVLSLGLQARRSLSGVPGSLSLGGEAVYHRWICKSDDLAGCGERPAANGFGLNGLVFVPVAGGKANVWASAGPKWLTDFEADGVVAFESGFGWHARLGVELPIGR